MRTVIFANGVMNDPGDEAAAWVRPGDIVVAADGGTLHALRAGLTPHHVIGDIDSLAADIRTRLEKAGTAFHVWPSAKDETDLELALAWAAGEDAGEIVVLGAFGGRPDQALANLLLLALPALVGRKVRFIDGAWRVRLIRPGESLRLTGAPGDRVSLLPLGGAARGVTTEGMAFPLRDETLAFGPARGVSNRFEIATPTVSVGAGMLWCFHERRAGCTPDGDEPR